MADSSPSVSTAQHDLSRAIVNPFRVVCESPAPIDRSLSLLTNARTGGNGKPSRAFTGLPEWNAGVKLEPASGIEPPTC